jgi:hypothetical protein
MRISIWNIPIILFIVIISATDLYSVEYKNLLPSSKQAYIIRLNNGDLFTGYITEMINDPEEGEGIKFKTELGIAKIFFNQITEITLANELYRHNHRVFLLPTAEPIGNNFFVGDFEMLFLYFGFGISDWLSITAGRTIAPIISSNQQISEFDAKFTLYNSPMENVARNLSIAAGANLAFINHDNRFIHLYGVGTINLDRSSLTASVFYKIGSQDFNILNFDNQAVDVTYENGSFGIGLGLDTKFTKRNDLHFIGELWNSNIAKPTNTGILLGFRLCNTNISADFGIAFFTQPLFVPITSFVWTPF